MLPTAPSASGMPARIAEPSAVVVAAAAAAIISAPLPLDAVVAPRRLSPPPRGRLSSPPLASVVVHAPLRRCRRHHAIRRGSL
jgi:hypothetical protein